MTGTDETFDPVAALKALDGQRVAYIIIGGLGRVIHGSDEVTHGLDIVPSTRSENLARLKTALERLNARRADGTALALDDAPAREPVLELETSAGELKIVFEPRGTRGYDDLRRGASREPLGHGLRPQVASVGDHARMLSALGREQDARPLRTLRRLAELERELGRGLDR
jgi:hypothetical protein